MFIVHGFRPVLTSESITARPFARQLRFQNSNHFCCAAMLRPRHHGVGARLRRLFNVYALIDPVSNTINTIGVSCVHAQIQCLFVTVHGFQSLCALCFTSMCQRIGHGYEARFRGIARGKRHGTVYWSPLLRTVRQSSIPTRLYLRGKQFITTSSHTASKQCTEPYMVAMCYQSNECANVTLHWLPTVITVANTVHSAVEHCRGFQTDHANGHRKNSSKEAELTTKEHSCFIRNIKTVLASRCLADDQDSSPAYSSSLIHCQISVWQGDAKSTDTAERRNRIVKFE